jgi:hypothetical protein
VPAIPVAGWLVLATALALIGRALAPRADSYGTS